MNGRSSECRVASQSTRREDKILGLRLCASTSRLLLWSSVAVVGAGLVAASASVAAPPHCGSRVTKDVTLHADLTGCRGNGLLIAADGVTVDLNGFAIKGSGLGINNVQGYDRVTVKSSGDRGEISGFIYDVAIAHGDDNVVRNLDAGSISVTRSSGGGLAHNRLFRGLQLSKAHQVRVLDNTIKGLSDSELDVDHSSRILVRDNKVISGHRAIFFSKTVRSRILSNEVNLADEPSIWLTHRSDHNVVARNVARGSFFAVGSYGIGVQVSNRNRIAHNLIVGALQGIVIGSPDSFLGRGFGRGISHGNVVTQNVARKGGIGIRAAQRTSAYTLLDRNIATLGTQGIRAGDPSTTLADNLAKKNEGHGISAVRGVKNLGGNVAVRNKGRPQCVHMHCRTVPPGT